MTKMLAAGAFIGVMSLGASCPPAPPNPSPTPTPSASTPTPTPTPAPSPTPTPAGPLVAQPDGRWQRDGQPFVWRQSIVCCGGGDSPVDLALSQCWPQISDEYIQWISFHRQNATHVRNWMTPQQTCGRVLSPYRAVGMKADLNAWDPDFWAYKRARLAWARDHNVVIEEDLIDTWVQQHGVAPTCAAWNVNGESLCGLDSMNRPLPARVRAFVRKVVTETCSFNNLTYQDGNEAWKGMSEQWSLDILAEVRAAEAAAGCARHPFGTANNSDEVRYAADYVTFEQEIAANLWCWDPPGDRARRCKPTHVNETAPLDTKAVMRQTYAAAAKGTAFVFWNGEQNQAERGRTLILREAWANGAPNPFPIADKCPAVAGIDAKVHQHVCNNQTSPTPCVGGSTVIDATPLFGRTGAGGVCNDEHDHCDGRICEPDGLKWTYEAPTGVRCYVQNFAHCEDSFCSVPCTPGQGYQLKCENQRKGHYRAQPHIDGQTDCYGVRLRPNTDGTVVEWDVE